MVPQTIVVRGKEANQCKASDAPYGIIVAELKDKVADGVEVACLCCGDKFCSAREFGAIVIRPDSEEEGRLGAVCQECALAATNDELIRAFQEECGARH